MKICTCLIALLSCVTSLPHNSSKESPDEHDLLILIPKDIYVEPISSARNQQAELKIVGGKELTPHSVPYQVAIVIDNIGFCGGSLISTNRVLTAGHCTDGASFVQVRLGAHELNAHEPTQVRITSSSIIIHKDYNINAFVANDISIIFLPLSVTLNNYIKTISLAPATSGSYAGSRAFLSGWGTTSDTASALSPVLKGVSLNIITNEECSRTYANLILSSSLCTSGAGGVGSCRGDSGGALVVNGVQVGIVSFGAALCEAGHPTVFARITSFRNWVYSKAGV